MINSKNFGLSGGIIWGGSLFLLTLISMATGYGRGFLQLISALYPGYAVSFQGSLWALILGFIDGFVALYLLAVIYNWLSRRRNSS